MIVINTVIWNLIRGITRWNEFQQTSTQREQDQSIGSVQSTKGLFCVVQCVCICCVFFFCSLWLKVMQLRLLQLCNLLLETHLMNVWTRARHTYFPNIIVAYLFIALKRRIVVINLGLISVQPFLGVYMSMRQCNALSYSLT